MDMVDLRSLLDYDSLKRDNWGIPTIGADSVGQREHMLENSTEERQGLDKQSLCLEWLLTLIQRRVL